MMEGVLTNPEFDAVEKLVILTDVLSGELANLEAQLERDEVKRISQLLARAEEIISGTVQAEQEEITKLVNELEVYAAKINAAY